MDFLCPGDPAVWDGRRFAPCYADLVLGLGGNVVAAVAVLALFVARRNDASTTENVRRRLPEKLFVFGVPSFAACLSLLGLILLVKKEVEGIDVPNHESFFRCSQFLAWVAVLVSANGPWSQVLCNPIMCICWMLKILLEIPHLQYTLTKMKALAYFREIVSFSMSVTFGLLLIVITVVGKLSNKREVNSIEAPLIPNSENSEDGSANLVKKHPNIWELLTFNSVNPIMDIGIRRQLDFTDLLELPAELRPASCYEKLLSSWTAEQQTYHAESSILRAMFYAYGWSYLRLGILKVINDSINFISPLLLNKFIRLIQEGSIGMDGYIIAISLGLTSIINLSSISFSSPSSCRLKGCSRSAAGSFHEALQVRSRSLLPRPDPVPRGTRLRRCRFQIAAAPSRSAGRFQIAAAPSRSAGRFAPSSPASHPVPARAARSYQGFDLISPSPDQVLLSDAAR